MKHYTSIEQSKKLLELGLSPESADMCWEWNDSHNIWHYVPNIIRPTTFDNIKKCIPCWSLAALLNVIPKRIDEFNVLRIDISANDFAIWYDEVGFGVNNDLPDITMESAVDACVIMIEKLHELNLL